MSFWGWAGDLISGPVGGAVVALSGVWITQRMTREEKRRDRDAAVEDKVREEVAELLEMRRSFELLQWEAILRNRPVAEALNAGEVAPDEVARLTKLSEEFRDHMDLVGRRCSRISFLTRDPGLLAALDALRKATDNELGFTRPNPSRSAGIFGPNQDRLYLRDLTNAALDAVEEATRELVARHGVPDRRARFRRTLRRPAPLASVDLVESPEGIDTGDTPDVAPRTPPRGD